MKQKPSKLSQLDYYRANIAARKAYQMKRYRLKHGIPLDAPKSRRGRPCDYDDSGRFLEIEP